MNDNDPAMHNCLECGVRTPNRGLICDPCLPNGYARRFSDDIDPASREPAERGDAGLA